MANTQRSYKPVTILVVEDSQETRELVCRMLGDAGWTVHEAENGAVALDKMAQELPDVVLLDLMMPVMDGFRFAELARQNPAYRSVPIVVLTAKELTADDHRQLESSVAQIVRKGDLSKDDLLLLLRSTVDKTLNPS